MEGVSNGHGATSGTNVSLMGSAAETSAKGKGKRVHLSAIPSTSSVTRIEQSETDIRVGRKAKAKRQKVFRSHREDEEGRTRTSGQSIGNISSELLLNPSSSSKASTKGKGKAALNTATPLTSPSVRTLQLRPASALTLTSASASKAHPTSNSVFCSTAQTSTSSARQSANAKKIEFRDKDGEEVQSSVIVQHARKILKVVEREKAIAREEERTKWEVEKEGFERERRALAAERERFKEEKERWFSEKVQYEMKRKGQQEQLRFEMDATWEARIRWQEEKARFELERERWQDILMRRIDMQRDGCEEEEGEVRAILSYG